MLGIFADFVGGSGLPYWFENPANALQIVMIVIACVLIYLAIKKGFEPLLLLPIAFGMLLANLPLAGVTAEPITIARFVDAGDGNVIIEGVQTVVGGLLYYISQGLKLGIFPPLIFIGVGAMTDFGPMIANPKSVLLGAAAQIGILVAFLGAVGTGLFDAREAASIGIIGGADGPTAIFITSRLAPHLIGPVAVAAYAYMALVPVIQPPVMKLLTTEAERKIVMKQLRVVTKREKIIFPILATILVALIVPSATVLAGCLMFGNIMKESGVVDRLTKTAANDFLNIVTILLGLSVGSTASAEVFLAPETLVVMALGVVAFIFGTAGGIIVAKIMNLFIKDKVNPLIGAAGVSAVPIAARVTQKMGQEADPSNFLLMHAMGPNVAGVIGSAVSAGVLIAILL